MSIIHTVIIRAKSLFVLKDEETEILANSAGLSLQFEGGYIIDAICYNGSLKAICDRAMISERMLRTYKKNANKTSNNCSVRGSRKIHRRIRSDSS